jgi:hypothetical protein
MTTQMLTWLADELRRSGLPVREVAGWKARGHGEMGQILGVLAHHTAGPQVGNYPSESVVVNGRPGLEGPLANLGLARDGTWVVIAAGQAWHAGTGSISWCPANTGNARLVGVEAESCGTRDDWTDAQRGSYPRGVAALLRYLQLPAERAIGHKEWAPTRKIDPAFWDMNTFRSDVARWLRVAGPTSTSSDIPAVPPRAPEDDVTYIRCQLTPAGPESIALLTGAMFVGLGSPNEVKDAQRAIAAGAPFQWVERATWIEFDRRSHALCDNPRPVAVVNLPSAGSANTA